MQPVVDWLVAGRADGAPAAGRAGRAVRPAARLRSAAAPGRRVRHHAASRHHGAGASSGARGEGVEVSEAALRHARDRHLSAEPGPGRLRDRRDDPPPDRGPGLPERLWDRRGDARRGCHRLSDPAAAVHQRRGARDQLDHAAPGRLRRRRHRRARGDPRCRLRAWSRSTRCAGSRPPCSTPTSAAAPASAFSRAASGAATSSASTP